MREIFDVIVVGFGFAGGTAAISAHDAGANVLLLEKQPTPGGLSVCAAGGVRIADNADDAFAYLSATNAMTAPDALLRTMAQGMTELVDYLKYLAAPLEAKIGCRQSPGNYPLPGASTFGFATVDELPGFDREQDFPEVRGGIGGARLFKLVLENVRRRAGVTVRSSMPVSRLLKDQGRVIGVRVGNEDILCRGGVILACGGFEADGEFQRQFWHMKPVLSAATRANRGDGLRMAQTVGAGLWHMWHFHGSYGFRHPDSEYPFGVRLKRLPDWQPGEPPRDVRMSWILVDQRGRRFMNEYEPYMQDTAHRALGHFDPVTQSYPRIPAFLIVDSAGRKLYPLSAPTWHDRDVATRFGGETPMQLDDRILVHANSLVGLADALGLPPDAFVASIEQWNQACAEGNDAAFCRTGASMMPVAEAPFYGAPVWPVVSNTQGGPVHDECQRILDAFGAPIPGLFVSGELGSVFGHLYMSGGNLAECFIGGQIAGQKATSELKSV